VKRRIPEDKKKHTKEGNGIIQRIMEDQNYWVCEFFVLASILQNRKHDISETGSVSIFKW
jgi:hypothetical protein